APLPIRYARPHYDSVRVHPFPLRHLRSHCQHLHLLFFFNATATTEIYTLSLHDALPISPRCAATERWPGPSRFTGRARPSGAPRSEEHTSELQSRFDLVCRLLLEKKKRKAA